MSGEATAKADDKPVGPKTLRQNVPDNCLNLWGWPRPDLYSFAGYDKSHKQSMWRKRAAFEARLAGPNPEQKIIDVNEERERLIKQGIFSRNEKEVKT